MSYNIRNFQKRYGLANKDIAEICNCSLPTIQKWRSGEVPVSGAAHQLMRLLDMNAEGSPQLLKDILGKIDQSIEPALPGNDADMENLESSMTKVVDRLEFMLESRRRDRELAESEARYRSMVESYANPVCRWLPDTTLTFVNEAYTKLFARNGENILGKKWIELVPKEQRHSLMVIISDMVRRGDEEVGIHEVENAEGEILHFEWRDIPIKNESGKVVELHSIGTDVTELINLRRIKDESIQSKNAYMELSSDPFVIFDEDGLFIEENEPFRLNVIKDKDRKGLGDMLPGKTLGKLKRLLKRIRMREAFGFQLMLDNRAYRMRGRLLSKDSMTGARYLAQFEELADIRNQVIQVRLSNELIIDGAAHDLRVEKDRIKDIEQRMNALGNGVDVDRVYVFIIDWEDSVFNNILEWCAPGVQPHIDDLQKFPVSEYPWWIDKMVKNQWIKFEDTSKMPRSAFREREVLVAQGIRSILVAPVVVNQKTVGFVGFDHNHTERIWHEQEHLALESFVKEIESFLEDGLK